MAINVLNQSEDDNGDVLTDIEQSCFGMVIKSVAVVSSGFALIFFLIKYVF